MPDLYNYLLIVLAWIIFGIVHSVLATDTIKEKAYKSGIRPISYRRGYNLLALILILLIFIGAGFIEQKYFMPYDRANKAVGMIIAVFGLFLMRLSFRTLSFPAFLGIREEEKMQKLLTTGIYRKMRHPLYASAIMILVGFLIFSPSYKNLIHVISLSVYFFIGILMEEKRMKRKFGKEYEKYRDSVPMLFPKLK